MERHGFVHDMLDVKVLILYIMARVAYPVDLQKIYELSYQDDGLSYFDVAEAVPQMIESGHLERVDGERYVITEKGREAGSVTEDSVAIPLCSGHARPWSAIIATCGAAALSKRRSGSASAAILPCR